jgi:hypothetical protein
MKPTDAPADSPLSEADVQAYADGTLSPARAAFLRDYLGRDPAEARRVAFYGSLNEQIQRSFQTADEPASTAFKARRGAASRWRNAAGRPRVRKAVRALVAVVVACAAVSGWFAATQVTIGLRLVDERVLSLGLLQRATAFVYLNGDNQPVILLSTLALLAPAQPQWSARRIGDVRLLTWTAQRQRFVVAGDARTHGLMRAADVMTMP